MSEPRHTTCPTCGWEWRRPIGPIITTTSWSGCACSDRATCLAHQINGERPDRPSQDVIAVKAQQRYEAELARYEAKRSQLAAHALSTLAANLATAAGLCEAFSLGFSLGYFVHIPAGSEPVHTYGHWRPGCQRSAR